MPDNALTAVLDPTANTGGTGKGDGSGFSGFMGEGSGPSGAALISQRAYVTGMFIALGAILMFFMALVSAWIVRKGFEYGDVEVRPLDMPWRLLWLNTLVLLASSCTLVLSRRRFLAQDESGFRHWWGVTTILGVFFLAGQLIVWKQLVAAGVYLATNPSSSFYYVFTASHGLHLLGGIAALAAVAFLPARRLTRATATKVVAMYWHFMGALWLALFLLFLLGYRA